MKKTLLTAAAAAMVAAGTLALAGCGSSAIQVKGKVLGGSSAAATVLGATGGPTSVCSGAVAGTQVIIKGPDGKLLATTTLARDAKASAALKLPAALSSIGMYDFRTSVPDGPGPFTVDLVGVNSLVVGKSALSHLQLSC